MESCNATTEYRNALTVANASTFEIRSSGTWVFG